jgi:class 3 adenylate cyclase
LFADISGYTPLTKAVMADLGPKRGAEVLTQHINRVFATLITAIHNYRGSIIGFSGDALTCWFEGDQGERALTCAVTMQEAMTPFASFEILPQLSASLAIKVALVVGTVRRFQVGYPRIQIFDVIAGATVARMAQAEKLASKGEIIIGVEVATHLQKQVEIVAWRQNKFAVVSHSNHPVAPDPWPTLAQPLSEGQVRAWILAPVYEQLKWGRDQFLGEYRRAIALFLKFEGIDYDDDDAAEAKLAAYLRFLQEILTYYQGYLLKLTIGDKGSYLLATFGAPLAHSGDALNAVTAALDIQALSQQFSFINNVQIGLSQGGMLVGVFGSRQRRAYDVLGDEANMAARLMSRARPGEVLLSERVAQAVAAHFKLAGPTPVSLKGSEQPLPVYQIAGRKRPEPTKQVLSPTALVGRAQELAKLEALWPRVEAGQGQIVRVRGVAGIGKSRLVTEFSLRTQVRGWQIVRGACLSSGQHLPYFPWQQLLRALLELPDEATEGLSHEAWLKTQATHLAEKIGQLNPNWLLRLPLLGDALQLPLAENDMTRGLAAVQRRELLFNLIIDLLQHQARRQPLLLIIEDGQWLDEVSKNLLLAVGRTVSDTALLLVIAHRATEAEDWAELTRLDYHHLLSLHELSLAGIEELVGHYLQRPPSRLLVSLLHACTQGNPFFIEELITVLKETGQLMVTE